MELDTKTTQRVNYFQDELNEESADIERFQPIIVEYNNYLHRLTSDGLNNDEYLRFLELEDMINLLYQIIPLNVRQQIQED